VLTSLVAQPGDALADEAARMDRTAVDERDVDCDVPARASADERKRHATSLTEQGPGVLIYTLL
jgi:hypothetical protein